MHVPSRCSRAGVLCWVFFMAVACSGEKTLPTQDDVIAPQHQPLYVALGTIWRYPQIPVCWENIDTSNSRERTWVQDAVEGSWARVSGAQFSGWGLCDSFSRGIRIHIADTGPHTKGLGSQLDSVWAGMVLNFTFNNWSPSCQNSREYCIRSIAFL